MGTRAGRSEREYVRRWAEAGRLLEEQRWQELRAMTPEQVLAASDSLIEAALQVPIPQARRLWSGLVEQQCLFHRQRR